MSRKKIVYFTQETQDAIVSYNNSTNPIERSYIYEKYIQYGIRKIIENQIHKHKFYHSDVDTMQQYIHEIECIVLEKLHLYKPDLGRAYSYFTFSIFIILINYNRENYKRIISKGTYDEVDNSDVCYKRYEINTYIKEELRTDYYSDDFIQFVSDNIEELSLAINKVALNRVELATANAILKVMKNRYNIDIFDKKSMFIYVKNIVKVSNQKFLNVFKLIKTLYLEYKEIHDQQDYFTFSEIDYEPIELPDNEIDEIFESYQQEYE